MLLKLTKIKNLGVFNDYSWSSTLPVFGRYNVIYGDNGSRKTTLARLLATLKIGSHPEYPHLEYRVDTQSGDLVQGHAATRNIRVFNTDYVELNVGKLDGSMKPILVIGEENKAIAESLELDQKELAAREASIRAAQAEKTILETAKGKVFTSIAKRISEAISGSTVRNYRKNNAETAFAALTGDNRLAESALVATRATVSQAPMETVSCPTFPDVMRRGRTISLDEALLDIVGEAKSLCLTSAVVQAIERLHANPEISQWVEAGYALHKALGVDTCEFCGGHVPENRWVELQAFFNTANQELRDALARCVEDIRILDQSWGEFRLPDRLALYPELREAYDLQAGEWGKATSRVRMELNTVSGRLGEKNGLRSTPITCDANAVDPVLRESFNAIAILINQHNEKTQGFELAKTSARTKLECHYLESIRNEVHDLVREIEAQDGLILESSTGGIKMTAFRSRRLRLPSQKSVL